MNHIGCECPHLTDEEIKPWNDKLKNKGVAEV
jgi:hypothetical protein